VSSVWVVQSIFAVLQRVGYVWCRTQRVQPCSECCALDESREAGRGSLCAGNVCRFYTDVAVLTMLGAQCPSYIPLEGAGIRWCRSWGRRVGEFEGVGGDGGRGWEGTGGRTGGSGWGALEEGQEAGFDGGGGHWRRG
jgi:hypothetical protein